MSRATHERPRARRRLRFLGAVFAAVIFAAGLSAVALQTESTPAAAAVSSFEQCNAHGGGPAGAPLVETCEVTIVNTVNALGQTGTTVFTRTCLNEVCTGTTATGDAVNDVDQCNGSNNVGGSTTTCSVNIINNISIDSPQAATALTLNQCVGSGGGGGTLMTGCIESTTGGATVDQCNGSGTGGGGFMTCDASGFQSPDFPITVDQCNGSENGGGSFVTCTVTMTTNIVDTSVETPPTGTPGGGTPGGTPGTGTPGDTPDTGTPGTGIPGTPETGTPGTPVTGTPPFVEVPPNYTG